MAALYDPGLVRNDRMGSAAFGEPRFLSGGGGLVSTAADYHRFTSMLLAGEHAAARKPYAALHGPQPPAWRQGAQAGRATDHLRDPERGRRLRPRLLASCSTRRARRRSAARASSPGAVSPARPSGSTRRSASARSSSPSSRRRARTRCAASCASCLRGAAMKAKLVGVVGSHPCISAELMLRYKGVEFTRLDLPNMSHKLMLPLLRYRGSTVPVITLEGKRVSGTMRIARALETLSARPAALPRRRGRRGLGGRGAAGRRAPARPLRDDKDPEAMASFLSGPLLGIPERARAPGDAGAASGRRAPDAHVRRHRQGLPRGAARASSTASTRCSKRA